MIATLAIMRFQRPHAALAAFYGVDRSTITRATGEIRPLLAARRIAVARLARAAAEDAGRCVRLRRRPGRRQGRLGPAH